MAAPAGILGAIRIAFVVGSLIAALWPKPRSVGPTNIQNLQLQTTMKGTPLPVIYGTQRVAGNIIWADKIKEHQSGGGKGGKGGLTGSGGKGGSGQNQTTFTCSFAIAFCEGPITAFLKLWEDKKLLDLTQYSNITFYLGTGFQTADPTLQAAVGSTSGVTLTESFIGSGSQPTHYLTNTPVVSGSDTIYYFALDSQGNQQQKFLARVAANPGQDQYSISYSSGFVQLGGFFTQTTTFYVAYTQQTSVTTLSQNTERYPYVAYIVFKDWNLGTNTRIQNFTAEIQNATPVTGVGAAFIQGSPSNTLAYSTDGQTVTTSFPLPLDSGGINPISVKTFYFDGYRNVTILGVDNFANPHVTSVWTSTNLGSTWTRVPVDPPNPSTLPIAQWILRTKNGVILIGTSANPSGSLAAQVIRSVDGGQSWQYANVGTGGQSAGAHSGTTSGCSFHAERQWQTPDGRVWACISNNGNFIEAGVGHLFSSSDDGLTWQLSITGQITNSLTGGPSNWFQYENGAYFWLEGRNANTSTEIQFFMYRSTDGVSWRQVAHDGDGVFPVNFNPPGGQSERQFMGLGPDGVWVINHPAANTVAISSDNGVTWGTASGGGYHFLGSQGGQLLAFDSSAHIVFTTNRGTSVGTLTSQFNQSQAVFFAPTSAQASDMNWADILLDLLPHTRYGGGIPLAQIDAAGTFSSARTYYFNNGILVSPIFKDRKQLLAHVEDGLIIHDTFLTWSQGMIRLIPRQAVQTPRALTTASYVGEKSSLGQTGPGSGNISHRLGRQTVKEVLNRVLVHYVDRSQEYTPSSIDARDSWMVGRSEGTELEVGAEMVTNQALANQVAFRILWVRAFNRLTATVTLGPQDFDVDPADVVSWTDANLGISGQLMRVMNISEDKDNKIKCDMIEENATILGWASFLPLPAYVVAAVQPPARFVSTVIIPIELPPPWPGGNPSIEIALSGLDTTWFGARLYASDDNVTYTRVLQVNVPTVWGSAVQA